MRLHVRRTTDHPDVQCLRLLFANAPTQAPSLPKVVGRRPRSIQLTLSTRQVLVLACRKASVEVVRALLVLLLPDGDTSATESIADVADVTETSPAGSHVSFCSDFDIGKCSTAKGLTPLLYDNARVCLFRPSIRCRKNDPKSLAPGALFGARPRWDGGTTTTTTPRPRPSRSRRTKSWRW